MKLEGWRIRDSSDGSMVILLVSKHFHKENTLSNFLSNFMEHLLPPPHDENLDIGEITITIPPTGEEGVEDEN